MRVVSVLGGGNGFKLDLFSYRVTRPLATAAFLGFAALATPSVLAQAPSEAVEVSEEAPLDPVSLIKYVKEGNRAVRAAEERLKVEAYRAERLSEVLTAVTPALESSMSGASTGEFEVRLHETGIGLRKQFFNGTRFFLGAETQIDLLDGDREDHLALSGSMPLGDSVEEAQNLVNNARNQNFFYDAQTRYVDDFAWSVWIAERQFYALVASDESTRLTKEAIGDLQAITTTIEEERAVIEDEISTLMTRIDTYQAERAEAATSLEHLIGCSLPPIGAFDFYNHEEYTDRYLTVPLKEVIYRAEENNLNIEVLERARELARTRLELTRNASVDKRLTGDLRYVMGDSQREGDYATRIGLTISLVDRSLLENQIGEATAEIGRYDAEIDLQRANTEATIRVEVGNLQSLIRTAEAQRENVRARLKTFGNQGSSAGLHNRVDMRLRALEEAVGTVEKLEQAYFTVATLNRVCGAAAEEYPLEELD